MVEKRKNPKLTTTLRGRTANGGSGKKRSEENYCRLGGSATNDGGCGAAAAAGVKFYNKEGKEFIPTGGTVIDIERIDLSGMNEDFKNIEMIAMCDIDNPMYGPFGASYVFAPQKGADAECVEELDEGMKNLSRVITRTIGKDIGEMPGTGAAGAMGAGMVAFFNAKLQMGIQTRAGYR